MATKRKTTKKKSGSKTCTSVKGYKRTSGKKIAGYPRKKRAKKK